MSLVARLLEENGIATVVLGSAKDILAYCGAPRFVFTDFPLGNPCGKPNDKTSQTEIFSAALRLLAQASKGGDSMPSNQTWQSDFDWKKNFMYVGPDNLAALREKGEARRAEQAEIRARILGNRGKAV